MKKTIRRLLVLASCIAILYSTASCDLPFKLVINTAEPDSSLKSTTPQVPVSTTQSPVTESQETPTPKAPGLQDVMMPITGSMLKWIDLSDFVYVPGGEFTMGADSTTPSDHAPSHSVNLDGFWIQQAEVTNQQYAACVAVGECTAPAQEYNTPYWYSKSDKVNAPVVGVTWLQANEYCTYIESRLPTEAEWEKAARGSQSNTYPWGKNNPNCDLLNYDDCLDPSEPENVRMYNNGASEFEAMDMAGNVFEWVNDWYANDYYLTSPNANPVGPVDGTKKVYRGGSYASTLDDVNPVMRFAVKPEEHSAEIGFRCVLTGDYSSSTNNQVPRPCEVLPVSVQPENQPTFTPIPCQPASVTAGCVKPAGKQARTWIDIYQSNCQFNLLSGFLSNAVQDLYCSASSLDANTTPKEYTCVSANMVQGLNVDVFFWHDYAVSQIELTCPTGFVLDKANSFCIPGGAWLPDPPCPYGYTELEGVCLPIDSYQNGCPVGFYELPRETSPNVWDTFCAPLDECLLQGAGANCSAPVCAAGQTYDPANTCCAVPGKLHQVCPVGLSMKIDLLTQKNYCEPVGYLLSYENHTVKIPYCATVTPTPTDPPPSACSSYGNQSSCEANGCHWALDATGAPVGPCQ